MAEDKKLTADEYIGLFKEENGYTPEEAADKIKALELQVEELKTAGTRSSKADPLGSVKVPKDKFLIVEQIRYGGEALGPSTAKDPVFSDLKKLSKEVIQKLLDRGTIR